MKRITKAIFPIAGLGTRFLPQSKVVSKELIPLGGKPLLHYNIEEAVLSGIEEIAFITRKNQKEAVDYLKINDERIRILPLFPTKVISENLTPVQPQKIDDNSLFIHYPAQFWAHKNHYNLVLAFKGVLEKYPNLKLIFTGSDQGNKTYIREKINELNKG